MVVAVPTDGQSGGSRTRLVQSPRLVPELLGYALCVGQGVEPKIARQESTTSRL